MDNPLMWHLSIRSTLSGNHWVSSSWRSHVHTESTTPSASSFLYTMQKTIKTNNLISYSGLQKHFIANQSKKKKKKGRRERSEGNLSVQEEEEKRCRHPFRKVRKKGGFGQVRLAFSLRLHAGRQRHCSFSVSHRVDIETRSCLSPMKTLAGNLILLFPCFFSTTTEEQIGESWLWK